MLTKEIPCSECDGKGFITICTENSIGGMICKACNGTGLETALMTRADRIRAMTDEELAVKLSNMFMNLQSLFLKDKWLPKEEKLIDYVLESLQKPANEDEEAVAKNATTIEEGDTAMQKES